MACEDKTIYLKTGSAVILNCVYRDSAGNPISINNMGINVDFIDPKTNTLLATASTSNGGITKSTEMGAYKINAGSSLGWPEGSMPIDILYTKNNDLQHTEDFILSFSKGKTQIHTVSSP